MPTDNTTSLGLGLDLDLGVGDGGIEKLISWEEICLAVLFCLVIVVTIVGNTLVILAILTTRRLRTVTNCFVMSLAVADWLVGIFVMPPAVALQLMGEHHYSPLLYTHLPSPPPLLFFL